MKKILAILMVSLIVLSTFFMLVAQGKAQSDFQLTTSPLSEAQPSWSPDGAKIVYRTSALHRHIWVMNSDGSDQTPLTSGSVVDIGPSYSPDGTQIAFQRWGFRGDYFDLMMMDADGTNVQRITYGGIPGKNEGTFEHPRWSKDGTKLVFQYEEATTGGSGFHWICTINIDGAGLEVLGRGMSPRFCCSDAKIIFSTDEFYEDGYCIGLMNADGTGMQILTDGPTDRFPHMSSITNRILFNRGGDLYIMEENGSNLAPITSDGTNFWAEWSPDEKYIAYESGKSGNADIWKMEAPAPPPPVGGIWIPINKFELLAPWISYVSFVMIATASIIYVRHRKKHQN